MRRSATLLCACLAAAAGSAGVMLASAMSPAAVQSAEGALPVAVTSDDLRAFLDPLVTGQLAERRIAGAVVSVVKDGVPVFVRAYGDADVASRRSMAPDTLVRIGSITKTFTALAVMQLVETGALDLDRDVNAYVDFRVPPVAEGVPVTLRRLLSHQTGFEDRRGAIGAASGPRVPLGPYLADHLPPRLHQNADIVAYSNSNAALAAYVVERRSGRPFEQYLADHIFQPLGMLDTTAVQPVPETLRPRVSNGYVQADSPPTLVSMAASTIYEIGSTGISSTAADMSRLMIAMLDREPGIVSRPSLDAMMRTQVRLTRGFFGLGTYAPVGAGGNAFIGHDGGTGSFHSTLALLPREHLGVFAAYNSDGVPAGNVISADAELVQRIAARYASHATVPASDGAPPNIYASYQPSRRVDSNVFTLRALFDQLAARPVAGGGVSLGPGYLPIQTIVLDRIETNLYRRSGLDVSFGTVGATATMQLGTAVYVGVPSWASARAVVPVLVAAVMVAIATVLAWPITWMRARRLSIDPPLRRLRLLTRVAFVLYLAALAVAFWIVFWGWPFVALSSPAIGPMSLGLYGLAWSAAMLTAIVVWSTAALMRRPAGRPRFRQMLQTLALVVLTGFCLYWRIAGTTLSF